MEVKRQKIIFHGTSIAGYLEVTIVMRVDTKTGNKTIYHEIHICTLAASTSGERLARIEQQGLRKNNIEITETKKYDVVHAIKLSEVCGAFNFI